MMTSLRILTLSWSGSRHVIPNLRFNENFNLEGWHGHYKCLIDFSIRPSHMEIFMWLPQVNQPYNLVVLDKARGWCWIISAWQEEMERTQIRHTVMVTVNSDLIFAQTIDAARSTAHIVSILCDSFHSWRRIPNPCTDDAFSWIHPPLINQENSKGERKRNEYFYSRSPWKYWRLH